MVKSKEELLSRIAALTKAELPHDEEDKELAALATAPAAAKTGTSKVDSFDIEVDKESFESGGQGLDSPNISDVYAGIYVGKVVPTNKPDQLWFIFKTNDPRVEAQKGRQVRSALITVPKGLGAFKLNDIIAGLGLPYKMEGNHVKFQIPIGLPCNLEYEEVVIDNKTQVRLQNVSRGIIAQAV